MNEAFWISEKKRFAFALDKDNHTVDEPSVLTTVPMWFGLLDEAKADLMITQLADVDHQTDWGMRIISGRSPKFSGGGYHYGSVWPLFTGWASVGEYRYHRALPGYENLRANALLTFDGSLGHVTEVLSGAYYQSLSTSSPHQIWSAAMVISPVLRGMLGLESDAIHHTLTFAPHVPADWTGFGVKNVRLGNSTLELNYAKTLEGIVLAVGRTEGSEECTVEFRPAISLRAKVKKVEWNGKPVPFRLETSGVDQHIVVRYPVKESKNVLQINLQNDFGLSVNSHLPLMGSASQGLRILSETWSSSRDQLELDVAGAAGNEYEIRVWNPGQVQGLEGAELGRKPEDGSLRIKIPPSTTEPYPRTKVVIHFGAKITTSQKEKQ
jgi:hypothetical protein